MSPAYIHQEAIGNSAMTTIILWVDDHAWPAKSSPQIHMSRREPAPGRDIQKLWGLVGDEQFGTKAQRQADNHAQGWPPESGAG